MLLVPSWALVAWGERWEQLVVGTGVAYEAGWAALILAVEDAWAVERLLVIEVEHSVRLVVHI